MDIFSMDSAFYRFMNKISELLLVNVLFLSGCLGIITIGPSLTAMYTVVMRMKRNESGYIGREFWKSYKENFRQSVVMNILFLVIGGVLYFDIILSGMIQDGFGRMLKVIFLFLGILYISVLSYLFAVQSRFENTIKNTIRNAFWMSVGYLPLTISVLVIEAVPIFIVCIRPSYFWYLLPVLLTVGFSVIGYLCAGIFEHIFKNYIPEEKNI